MGHGLPFTFQGLVVASTLYSLPFAVQPIASAFASVDRKLVEASWMLGVSTAATFFRVIVPLSWTGLVTGFVLSFAHTMGESSVLCSWLAAIYPGNHTDCFNRHLRSGSGAELLGRR